MTTSAAHGEQLIPGIPNEITLEHITPKMPWKQFYTLSGVSHAWLHAIRGRQVHNARVRSHTVNQLALLTFTRPDGAGVIALYSMREDSWTELPPIPDLEWGVPWSCQCVSLDGKVYVLGGECGDHITSSDAHY
ncbi:unnamed protein product [Calypogeia fissa]